MLPSFMNRMAILSPSVATIGEVAGKPRPLIVKPPSESLLIQTMSCVTPYSSSYRSAGSFGSTMNAPSRPRPTWSVALWCEWYMCDPGVRATNS